MTDDLKKVCESNNIKVWHENNKWYMEGESGCIARCLRASRARQIKVDGLIYSLDDVAFYLSKYFNIKFAYEELIY